MNQSNKKQGKVVSIPVSSPKVGMQVWHPRKYDISKITALRESVNGMEMVTIQSGSCTVDVRVENIRQLVVEYEGQSYQTRIDYGPEVLTTTMIRLPIKFSQWQSAIDNGQVDSDKIVEFEIINKYPEECSSCSCTCVCKPLFSIAKIIPAKRIYYTKEEIKKAIEYAIKDEAERISFAFEGIVPDYYQFVKGSSAHEDFMCRVEEIYKEWTQQYNYEHVN